MSREPLLIGVDGGATKTKGIITTAEGREIGSATGGSTNQYNISLKEVKSTLHSIIEALLRQAHSTVDAVRGICLGLAGVDKPEDAKRIHKLAESILPGADINVVNDSVIALFGGCLKPYGIIVISGTGSIAYGRNRQGQEFRAGGWGHILGDEGSGYAIGLQALRAVCRASDGRARSTLLTELLLRALSLKSPVDLIDWTKKISGDKAQISSLAPIVEQAVLAGDRTANYILSCEASELVLAVQAVRRKLFKRNETDIEVVVGGSNLCKSEIYFKLFKNQAEKKLKGIKVIFPKKEPVNGAIFYLQLKYGLVKIE
ncbi:MAG: hypothetical protein N2246_01885 [Candidatus Sumerlaeia bacterium]|nr:hypothetical protein [Candidatus Sumerlaeia bacterium]